MKGLFEEYGRTIIVIVATVAVLALLFVRQDFLGILGTVADVNTGVSHSQGESALSEAVARAKPSADFSGVELHVYNNHAFQPLKDVIFKDAAGVEVDVVVTSILHQDSEGNVTEMVDYYNSSEDIIVLNPAHYTASHTKCLASEFAATASGNLAIDADSAQNSPGIVSVTYMATDDEKQVTVKQLTFVVDSKVA